ncbi:hypothetical protein ABID22_001589 [Pontibacter aydingkolensis]
MIIQLQEISDFSLVSYITRKIFTDSLMHLFKIKKLLPSQKAALNYNS